MGERLHERFGEVPQAVFHEGNSVLHTVEYEGDPRRRPLTYDEIQALFDAADARPGQIRGQGRKGALGALRDAAVLKTVYAFGAAPDARRPGWTWSTCGGTARRRRFGSIGSLMVRFGKSSEGLAAQAADGADRPGDGLGGRRPCRTG